MTPPRSAASQRAPTRERQLPVTISPRQEPADHRITARSLVAVQTGPLQAIPPTRSGKQVRQVAPPTDTANLLRQSESANQRAPTAGVHNGLPATSRSSHRRSLMSLGSKPHRHRQHRQPAPPTDTAKVRRQSKSANQGAPTVANHLAPSETCRFSHRSMLMSFGPTLHRYG
jgi:hypothetical protein